MSPSPTSSVSQFIEERRFLKNCTAKTIAWHEQALLKAFGGCTDEASFKQRIVELRQRGVAAISVNSWIRSVNAYLRWRGETWKLPRLQEEHKILATFSAEQVTKLLAYQAKIQNTPQSTGPCSTVARYGLRIAEALALPKSDIDLTNLLIDVKLGKGRKQRKVPCTLELRRRLYLYLRGVDGQYVFTTRLGSPLTIRNAQRDIANLCRRTGISGVRASAHTLRHSMATFYLKSGGNLEYLRRILGHSSILVTQRYLQSIQPEDLQAKHISPLGGARQVLWDGEGWIGTNTTSYESSSRAQ